MSLGGCLASEQLVRNARCPFIDTIQERDTYRATPACLATNSQKARHVSEVSRSEATLGFNVRQMVIVCVEQKNMIPERLLKNRRDLVGQRLLILRNYVIQRARLPEE